MVALEPAPSALWSVRLVDSVLARNTPPLARWHYEHGFFWKALEQLWLYTSDDRYVRLIQETLCPFIDAAGNIATYQVTEYNLDQVNPGKELFLLHRLTGDARYEQALRLIRRQIQEQPRTQSNGFWHKQIYPYQMWLDGIYMAAPFYAEFARTFDEPAAFDDVLHQIVLVEAHTRDPHTGLLYHAWDERRAQPWADPRTGCSPHFWGRAMGWYVMALVDVLDYFPESHAGRRKIIAILERTLDALANVQDKTSGLWYQILDQDGRPGNYGEASASCMFVYAAAKGVRNGYLPAHYQALAEKGYEGIRDRLLTVDAQGLVTLEQTCGGAGLGGNPHRDGSYAYYISEPVVRNDYKGVAAFVLAEVELARLQDQALRAIY